MKTLHRFHKTAVAVTLIAGCIGAAEAEGLYVGGSLGTPNYRDSINGISGKGSGVGGKVYGGYQIIPNFAVEAGYFDLGHIDVTSGKVNTRGAFVDGVGMYEFAPAWSVLGRVGLAQGRFTTSTGDDSSAGLRLGAGLEYGLSKTIALRGEYADYHFTNAFGHTANIGEFTAGVKIGF